MGERDALSAPSGDALGDFVAATRRWTGVQVELAPELSAVCRAVVVADLAVGGWAMVVLGMKWSCAGFVCAATTLGGRPALLLVWTMACVLVAAVVASSTGGMVRAGAGQLAALALTTVLGVVAALGAVVVLVVAALAVATAVDVLLTVIERI
jgi:hypothetical protein